MTKSFSYRAIVPKLFASAFMIAIHAGCSSKHPTERTIVLEDVTGSVRVAESNYKELPLITRSAAASLYRTMSAFNETNEISEINKINNIGSSVWIPVSPLIFRAIDLCRHYNTITAGAFDLTTSPIAVLWTNGPPDEEALENALAHSGMGKMATSDNGTVALTIPGLRFTPGLMVPAYALDICVADMRRKYRGPMLLQFGPFARRDGIFPETAPPQLAIRYHDGAQDIDVGSIRLSDATAAAVLPLPHLSRKHGDKPSAVLVDPRTGRPASGARIAAVVGDIAVKAYALAEALLVLGPEDGADILENFPGYEAFVISYDDAATAWATPGFKRMFTASGTRPLNLREWTSGENQSSGKIARRDF